MSIPDAAVALGVSTSTIRAMIRRGQLRAERVRRPQGYTLRVFLDGQVSAAATSGIQTDSSDQLSAQTSYQPPTSDLQRAEALAAYGATLLTPVLAELEVIRQENRDLARENGQLRAQLAAAEALAVESPDSADSAESTDTPRPWWRRWAGWRW
jgi:excisionase family DNA binding protein